MQRLPPSPSSDYDQQRGTDTENRRTMPPSVPGAIMPRQQALRLRKEKRFQVSRACSRCKRLQKGCSQSRPCQRCVAVGLGKHCTDQPSPTSTPTAENGGRNARNHAAEIPPAFGRRKDLLMDQLLPHCLFRFLSRMQPTVPLLTADYADKLQSSAFQPAETTAAVEAYGLLHAVCAMVLLQVDRNGTLPVLLPDEVTSDMRGSELLKEALRAHHHCLWSPQATPTLERVLLTFFIYACHSALSHHSRAFKFLREATTVYLLLSSTSSNKCLSPSYKAATAGMQDRVFWLLLVSERSHAIRYRRPITLYITQSSPPLLRQQQKQQQQQQQKQQQQQQQYQFVSQYCTSPESGTATLGGFWSLAALFAPLNTMFFSLLLEEESPSSGQEPEMKELAASLLASIERQLGDAVPDRVDELEETQKANLVVTQLWLRIIVWQLRLRLGLLTDVAIADGHESEPHNREDNNDDHSSGGASAEDVQETHPTRRQSAAASAATTYWYPLDAVRQARATLDELATDALAIHGVGMTEKLYDIACSMADVLALSPVGASGGLHVHEENLRFVWGLVSDLPGGAEVYDGLLRSHLEMALSHFQG